MLCLRCTRNLTSSLRSPIASRAVENANQGAAKRTFTSLTLLRPTLSSFRPPTLSSTIQSQTQTITEDLLSTSTFNLIPDKLSISTHPAFAGVGSQVRCAPRNTFDPSHFVRKRRHGFLSRVKTRKGRMLLKRRRGKGRSTMSH